MTVTIYSTRNCQQCELTRRDMDILGIEYRSIDITENEAELRRLAGMGFRSAPVVESPSGTWAGYDQERIKELVSWA